MILLGQPSYNGVHDGTSVDRQQLIYPEGVYCRPCSIPGTFIPEARCRIADFAMREPGCTHVLWTDADMRFPPDTLMRLLEHDLDMVGVSCRARVPPHRHAARVDGAPIKLGTGLQRVDQLGFGVVLMKTSLLRRTLESQGDPLFLHEWLGRDNGHPVYGSEDYYFCDKVRAAGFEIYIDHDLSRECRHITSTELTYEA